MKRIRLIVTGAVLIVFLLTACNFSALTSTQTANEDAINTSVAQTMAAVSADGGSATTPQPDAQPSLTPQALDTVAPLPTATFTATATATEDACYRAKFVDDITVEDGSIFAPNTDFVKTWRFTNTGTCTWNTNFQLVFSGGDQMGAPDAVNLPGTVAPGATVDISVPMKSPATDGDYAGNYMLRSDTGIVFGTGASHMAPVYVSIEVFSLMVIPGLQFGGFLPFFPLETLVYDFGANYCIGNWKNATDPGYLACPGAKTDATGFVVKADSPKLQDGNTVSGVGLLTHPQWIDGGSISGTFPLLTVEDGMKLKAILGCGYGGSACSLRFYLRYRVEGGALQTINNWDVKYTDAPLEINADLSALAGKNVNFVLQVVTNGSSAQDWAYWVNPRIVK